MVLKMTSRLKVTLQNLTHMLDMRKNLVSGTLLNKNGLAMTFEAEKLMNRKSGVYLGKGYVKDGLVKMNIITVLPKIVALKVSLNKKKPVTYLVESFYIWHERLGHVNYKLIKKG